jgi:hypothetical protein
MNGDTAMDDRFDRRELLLHLGDILEALSCLAKTCRTGALVRQLATEQDSLQGFEFLRVLSPKMTVAEFGARVRCAVLQKAHGVDSDYWTTALLRSFIEAKAGVRFSRVYVWQIANNLGLGHRLSSYRR